jgi:hypothetical protein
MGDDVLGSLFLPSRTPLHSATLPWRGRVGSPKAIRGGVKAAPETTATPHMRKRCHPLPAR